MQWFTLYKEAAATTGHSAVPFNIKLLIVLIDLPVAIYLLREYSGVTKVLKKAGLYMKIIAALSVAVVLLIEWQNYALGCSIVQCASDKYKGESPIVERYGTVADNIVNIYSNASETELISQLHYGKKLESTVESPNNPNFIVIQVESMDANVINHQYNGQYIAPFLHSLSQNCVYYPYMLSYHKGGATSDSEFSVMNSVETLNGYPAIKLLSYDYSNSFVSRLDASSYNTVAFHGNVGSFYNRDTAFPKMGFSKFYDMNKMKLKDVGWGAPDADVFNYAFNELNNINKPFFSYVITMTSHGPFTNARYYYNNARYDDIKDETVRNYFNSISYVDESIKQFVEKVRQNFKNTYVFIWGDHTPNISTEMYHQASIKGQEHTLEFVPLLIITPDGKVYSEKNQVACFTDISPTILKASGIKYSIKSDGMNVLDEKSNGGYIPYNGSSLDRSSLFKTVEAVK
ncbi:MAG TPA: LTA synthase family protein [Clostridia bacterium]